MDESVLEKIDGFFTKFKYQTYKKGEALIRADDEPSGIFYLKQGYVKQYTITKKGDEIIVNIFQPISFFPMSWAINNTKNTYYFEAMNDVKVWRAPKEEVINFIRKEPEILYNLMSRVFLGIDGMLEKMTYLMASNAYSRVVMELVIQAKRFGKKQENIIEIHITEKDLAAESGITRETVSREIKILKEKGLVRFDKSRLIIRDLKKLEDELTS